MPNIEWVRVKDKDTGHKYSVPAGAVDENAHQVLKQPAADLACDPLPAEHNESPAPIGQKATTEKESN